MEKQIILEVKNLSVTIGKEILLSNISFSVNQGEALAVIGPNGAGKTMLFRTLLGLVPYSGEIHWRAGVTIGYVPQKLFFDRAIPITVQEFFLLKGNRFWFPPLGFLKHLAHELELVGLPSLVLKKAVGDLSGGELQRLLIAWAMLNHPDVLLFDESTAGIDIGFEETIYHLLQRVQKERGTTILLISHELSIIYRYADKVLCLNKNMLCHGRPQEVLDPEGLNRLYGAVGFYQHVGELR